MLRQLLLCVFFVTALNSHASDTTFYHLPDNSSVTICGLPVKNIMTLSNTSTIVVTIKPDYSLNIPERTLTVFDERSCLAYKDTNEHIGWYEKLNNSNLENLMSAIMQKAQGAIATITEQGARVYFLENLNMEVSE